MESDFFNIDYRSFGNCLCVIISVEGFRVISKNRRSFFFEFLANNRNGVDVCDRCFHCFVNSAFGVRWSSAVAYGALYSLSED